MARNKKKPLNHRVRLRQLERSTESVRRDPGSLALALYYRKQIEPDKRKEQNKKACRKGNW